MCKTTLLLPGLDPEQDGQNSMKLEMDGEIYGQILNIWMDE